MYRVNYGYKEFGGTFYWEVENCNSFAEAERKFFTQEHIDDLDGEIVKNAKEVYFIKAIEKI